MSSLPQFEATFINTLIDGHDSGKAKVKEVVKEVLFHVSEQTTSTF